MLTMNKMSCASSSEPHQFRSLPTIFNGNNCGSTKSIPNLPFASSLVTKIGAQHQSSNLSVKSAAAFGLAESNASAAASTSTVNCSSSAHLGAVRTTLNGRPSAIKYRDYYLQRRRAAALNNRWKVQ